jgi:hypothetical protein
MANSAAKELSTATAAWCCIVADVGAWRGCSAAARRSRRSLVIGVASPYAGVVESAARCGHQVACVDNHGGLTCFG